MNEIITTENVNLDERITRLRNAARQGRNWAGFYAGVAVFGVGMEVFNSFSSNNTVAAIGCFIVTAAGVGLGIPQALESTQLGNEITALAAVKAQQASQPESN